MNNGLKIKFDRLNLDVECYYDCINDRGFLIKEPPYADIDKSIRNMDGPRSPRYGTTYGDTNEFMDRYRCECGALVGAAFEGEVCPKCGKEVQFKDVDIQYTGYLNFSPFHIISPLMYQRLQSAIGRKNLENIIANDNIITANGQIRHYNDIIEVKKSQLRYHNIGLKEFYDNYEEIMEYFKTKRKDKVELIDQLIKDKAIVWTSKYPVYSSALRPEGINVENFYFSPLNIF